MASFPAENNIARRALCWQYFLHNQIVVMQMKVSQFGKVAPSQKG